MKRIAVVAALSGTFFVAALSAQRTSDTSSDQKAWIGVGIQRNENDNGKELKYPIIVSVEPDSPADSAGLTPGDTVLKFGGIDAHANPFGLRLLLKPDRQVRFRVRHNGFRTVTVVARKRPELVSAKVSDIDFLGVAVDDAKQEEVLASVPMLFTSTLVPIAAPSTMRVTMAVAGASLARMNAGLAEVLHVQNQGVFVLEVTPATPAMRAGLRGGDVILKVNAILVNTPSTLLKTMSAKTAHDSADRRVALDVVRMGKERRLTLRW